MSDDARRDEFTTLLQSAHGGDSRALGSLLPIVYQELRAIAQRQLRNEKHVALQPTELVHEAYLRLVNQKTVTWRDRNHFFALAAKVMRQLLIDYIRKRNTLKRGGGQPHVTLTSLPDVFSERSEMLLALDEALAILEQRHPRMAKLVECRFFAGMTTAEAAEVLGVSLRTADREWQRAKAYLYDMIKTDPPS